MKSVFLAVLAVMVMMAVPAMAQDEQDEWKISAVETNNGFCGSSRIALLIDDFEFPKSYTTICIPREEIEELAANLGADNSDLAGRTFSKKVAKKSRAAKELIGDLKEYHHFAKMYFSKK